MKTSGNATPSSDEIMQERGWRGNAESPDRWREFNDNSIRWRGKDMDHGVGGERSHRQSQRRRRLKREETRSERMCRKVDAISRRRNSMVGSIRIFHGREPQGKRSYHRTRPCGKWDGEGKPTTHAGSNPANCEYFHEPRAHLKVSHLCVSDQSAIGWK